MDMSLGSLVAHLKLDSSAWLPGIASAEGGIDRLATKVGWFGAKMSVAITAPLALIGRNAVKEFGAFDEAITKSMAVMEGATDSMRKDLESVALSLSTRVATSATNLAGGFFELGQAGLTAAQSIGALPITEKFAFAGTMGLSQAVSYLTKSQRSLGLEMKDPLENMQQMQRVADNLTYAAIESTAEMIDFSEAMKNAGPALRILNKDIEEGTAALMALANQGHVGSEAGSQLYMVYRDLQRANIRNREIWDQMNLSVYDSAGEMLNLADIIEQLEKKFSGMSDEGVRTILMMLGFQDRSLRATQALFGLSGQMREFEKELRKAGGMTDKVANQMLKSFNAQMAILSNKIFIIRRDIGEILAKQLQSLGTLVDKLVSIWKNLDQPMKEFIVKTAEIIALIGPAAIVFGGFLKIIASGVAIFGFLLSPIGLISAALIYLGLASKEVSKDFSNAFGAIRNVVQTASDKIKNWSDTDSKLLVTNIKIAAVEISTLKDKFIAFVDYLQQDFAGATALVWELFLNGMEAAGKAAIALATRVGRGIWGEFRKTITGHDYTEDVDVIKRAQERYVKRYPYTPLEPSIRERNRTNLPVAIPSEQIFARRSKELRYPLQHINEYKGFLNEEAEVERQKAVEGYFEGLSDQFSGFIKEAQKKNGEDVKNLLGYNTVSEQFGSRLQEIEAEKQRRILKLNADAEISRVSNAVSSIVTKADQVWSGLLKRYQDFQKMKSEVIDNFAFPNMAGSDPYLQSGTFTKNLEGEWVQKVGWDFDLEELERMSDQAREIVSSLYAGLDQSSLAYWENQEEKLNHDIGLWNKYLPFIAKKAGISTEKLKSLIDLYEESQKKALERERVDQSFQIMDSMYSVLQADAEGFFVFQDVKLDHQTKQWEESAAKIAADLKIEESLVWNIIKAYKEKTRTVFELTQKGNAIQTMNTLYGGIPSEAAAYRKMQEESIENQAKLWELDAGNVAKTLNLEISKVKELINLWKDYQKVVLQRKENAEALQDLNTLYAGIPSMPAESFQIQTKLIEDQIDVWIEKAAVTAQTLGMEEQELLNLIGLWGDYQKESLKKKGIEQAMGVMDSLYSGLLSTAEGYFTYQEDKLEYQAYLWEQQAESIAYYLGIELEAVWRLIDAWKERQKQLQQQQQVEKAFQMLDTLYSGIHRKSKDFFDFQERKLQHQISLLTMQAEETAKTPGMELEQVQKLIEAYGEYQNRLIDIAEMKESDSFFKGFKAGIMEMEDELKTMGELGADIAKSLRDNMLDAIWDIAGEATTLEDALRRIALSLARQAFDWSGQQIFQMAMKGFSAIGMAGSATGATDISSGIPGTMTAHTGGVIGTDIFATRNVPAGVFSNAMKAHTGIGPDERPVIIQKGEGVFTPGQMKALGQRQNRSRDKEIVDTIRELIYVTRKQKIVQPIVVDRREDMVKVYQRDYLRRGKLTKGFRG